MTEIYEQIDEYADIYFCKNIILKLSARSYEKDNLENIEKDIVEVLNDKAFDNIAWFEVIE